MLFSILLLYLIKSNFIFSIFYFIVSTWFSIGCLIYFFREDFYYNLKGDPEPVYQSYIIFFITLFIISFFLRKKYFIFLQKNIKYYNSELYILLIAQYVGFAIFTSGFSSLPIFSDNIDAGRSTIQTGSAVGIGWVLMVLGSINFSRILRNTYSLNKMERIFYVLITYFPFVVYGGRSLIIFPLIVHILTLLILNKTKFNPVYLFLSFIFSVPMLMYFSVWREFGYVDLDNFQHLNYMFADAFSEFRISVNVSNNISDDFNFLMNVISGQIPSFFYELVGLSKSDYYVNIGRLVTEATDYSDFDAGIRIGLIGEFFNIGFISKILLVLTLFIWFNKTSFSEISIIVTVCIIMSSVYGINFLMNGLQFFIYGNIIMYFISNGKSNFRTS